jgi:hypothetical protein
MLATKTERLLLATALMSATSAALAGSVLSDTSGTAHLYVGLERHRIIERKPLSAPASGSMNSTDELNGDVDLAWTFTSGSSAAELAVTVNAKAGSYETSGGDVTLAFSTAEPLNYHLMVQTDDPWHLGYGLHSSLDGQLLEIGIPYDREEQTQASLNGVLSPGQHTFFADGDSAFFKFVERLDMVGQVKLQLQAPPTAIPLPAGFWLGGPILAGLAVMGMKRGIVERLGRTCATR